MLIVLGGFLGSGRRVLQKQIAEEHGFYNLDTDQYALRAHSFNVKRQFTEQKYGTNTDRERIDLFVRMTRSFPLLSKMYSGVVTGATFHRRHPREYFFTEARRFFDPVLFVWVDSAEEEVKKQLNRMHEAGLIRSVEEALKRREKSKREFEPFAIEPTRFLHYGTPSKSEERLWSLIQTLLH